MSAKGQASCMSLRRNMHSSFDNAVRDPSSSLTDLISAFDTKAQAHTDLQKIYTVINDKLVGLLIRTRKHHLTYFEGEVLFQKRDDDVPVFLMQPIAEIRNFCTNKSLQARRSVSPMPS
ncbi:Uncharacterized protein OBRU01_00133 [Operophtera brumata]|uniref:Costars domain-containing protein n=1 Tax=Operophtera brumata TaxID=104452 RepID=A0A0L7LVV5_OPEBR|nr:Uncharacterized protein OBRU01_00133 [Operophtera brumata]